MPHGKTHIFPVFHAALPGNTLVGKQSSAFKFDRELKVPQSSIEASLARFKRVQEQIVTRLPKRQRERLRKIKFTTQPLLTMSPRSNTQGVGVNIGSALVKDVLGLGESQNQINIRPTGSIPFEEHNKPVQELAGHEIGHQILPRKVGRTSDTDHLIIRAAKDNAQTVARFINATTKKPTSSGGRRLQPTASIERRLARRRFRSRFDPFRRR